MRCWVRGVVMLVLVLSAVAQAADMFPVLVVRPEQPTFAAAAASLQGELGPRYAITTLVAPAQDDGAALPGLAQYVALPKGQAPRVVVAFDNRVIRAVRAAVGPGGPPVVAAMGLNLMQELSPAAGVCGVSFDVAPFTLVTRFQALTHSRIRAVLLPYRGQAFATQVADAIRQLDRAGIRVVARDVTADGADPQRIAWVLERYLAGWAAEEGIDAVVVPSDSVLVNRRTLPLWIKVGRRSSRPFLTGIEALATPDLSLCVFAAAPDPHGIGSQVAQLVVQLVEDRATPAQLGIEPPIQILSRWDQTQADRLGLTLHDPAQDVP